MDNTAALEWCDANMHNKYPIADDASTMSTTGIYLPSSFLVDIQLLLPGASDEDAANRLYISAIERYGDTLDVFISYHTDADSDDEVCAVADHIPLSIRNTASIDSRTFEIRPTRLTGATIPSVSGRLIVGSCIDMLWVGRLEFDYEATRLLSLRVYVVGTALDYIKVKDSLGVEHVISDNFVLEAGDGIDIKVEYGSASDDGDESDVSSLPVIVVSKASASDTVSANPGADGDIASVDELISIVRQVLGDPICKINGIPPDSSGNFTLQAGTCVNISDSGSRLLISNPCSQPCCTEGTVSDVRASLDVLAEAQTRLLTYYTTMSNNVNAMQARLASLIASVE